MPLTPRTARAISPNNKIPILFVYKMLCTFSVSHINLRINRISYTNNVGIFKEVRKERAKIRKLVLDTRAIFVPTIFLFRFAVGLRDCDLKPVLAMGIVRQTTRYSAPDGTRTKTPANYSFWIQRTRWELWNSVETLPSGIQNLFFVFEFTD